MILIEDPSSNEFLQLGNLFLRLSGTRCSIAVSPVPKRSSTKKINNSYHGFSCSWTSCNGIQHFIKFCIVTMCRVILVPRSITRLCRVQRVTASISSRGNHAIATQSFVKDVPPASGHHSCHMQVSSILQQCKEDDFFLVVTDTTSRLTP